MMSDESDESLRVSVVAMSGVDWIIDGDECFEYVLYIYCLFDFWYVLNCSIVVEYIVGV
jgi:hypothetical protein